MFKYFLIRTFVNNFYKFIFKLTLDIEYIFDKYISKFSTNSWLYFPTHTATGQGFFVHSISTGVSEKNL